MNSPLLEKSMDFATQIPADIPSKRDAQGKRRRTRRLTAWEIVLLILGSPIWLSLVIAAVAVLLSLYAVLWSMIAAIWAVFASLVACAPVGIVAGIIFIIGGNAFSGSAVIASGILCAGLGIFLFFGCLEATKGTVLLTKKIAVGIQKRMMKKENV